MSRRYAIHLCGLPEDPKTYTRHIEGVDCPNEAEHTPEPHGYLAWHEWADAKSKTHRQTRCSGCGRLAIWKPRKTRAR
jgi:hypothetical protein